MHACDALCDDRGTPILEPCAHKDGANGTKKEPFLMAWRNEGERDKNGNDRARTGDGGRKRRRIKKGEKLWKETTPFFPLSPLSACVPPHLLVTPPPLLVLHLGRLLTNDAHKLNFALHHRIWHLSQCCSLIPHLRPSNGDCTNNPPKERGEGKEGVFACFSFPLCIVWFLLFAFLSWPTRNESVLKNYHSADPLKK